VTKYFAFRLQVSNFDDFYEQSFQGGKEYLRVLNELLGDFEDLFDLEKYRDIEKIKTIGSCLMAASGLNPMKMGPNRDPNAHLYELMDFSLDILKKIEAFNKDMFNFNFVMSIGYNFGEVGDMLGYVVIGCIFDIGRVYSCELMGRAGERRSWGKEELGDREKVLVIKEELELVEEIIY